MADDDSSKKTGEEEAGSEDERSDKDDSSDDSPDQDASAGDVGSGKDGEKTGKGRAGERIQKLVDSNKKLEEKNEDLATRLEALETALAKGGAPDTKKEAKSDESPAIKKLKDLGYTDAQIEAAKLVYQSVAGQTDSELKKEVESLRQEIAANKEKEALNEAIISAKKDGIEVSPKQIAEFRKQCLNSTDPREQLLAEAPYPRIIKMMLMDGVISKKQQEDAEEEEAGEEEQPKRKPEPKIPSGKDSRQEKKPTSKRFQFDPGNPQAGMDALERRVLARIGADDDE
jgi:hypothetical protein